MKALVHKFPPTSALNLKNFKLPFKQHLLGLLSYSTVHYTAQGHSQN